MNNVTDVHFVTMLSMPVFTDKMLQFFVSWEISKPYLIGSKQRKLHEVFESSLQSRRVLDRFEVKLIQKMQSQLSLERRRQEALEFKIIAGLNKTSKSIYCTSQCNEEDEL